MFFTTPLVISQSNDNKLSTECNNPYNRDNTWIVVYNDRSDRQKCLQRKIIKSLKVRFKFLLIIFFKGRKQKTQALNMCVQFVKVILNRDQSTVVNVIDVQLLLIIIANGLIIAQENIIIGCSSTQLESISSILSQFLASRYT